jgi:hypothetical protein
MSRSGLPARQPGHALVMVNRMIPRSLHSGGGGPVPPTSLPRRIPRSDWLLDCSWRAGGLQCGSDIWLIPLPSSNLRWAAIRCQSCCVLDVLAAHRSRHPLPALSVRSPDSSPPRDGRGLVIKLPRPPQALWPTHRPSLSNTSEGPPRDGRGCSLGGSLHASAP